MLTAIGSGLAVVRMPGDDGASSVISQNRGAGKYKRTVEIFYFLMLCDVMIGVIGLAAVSVGLPWLAQIFAQSKNRFDAEFCQMIVDIHRWEMLGYITLGIHSASNALLLGYGYAKRILFVNMARVFAFRIPVLWFLQNFTRWGLRLWGLP